MANKYTMAWANRSQKKHAAQKAVIAWVRQPSPCFHFLGLASNTFDRRPYLSENAVVAKWPNIVLGIVGAAIASAIFSFLESPLADGSAT
jgi:hypothetical protein